MTINQSLIKQVRQSHSRCCNDHRFFDIFYEHFLGQSQEIAALFEHTDWYRQKNLIKHALKSALLYAEEHNTPIVRKHIEDIGNSHSKSHMNIKPEYYPLWLESMLYAIQQSDKQYTPELGKAWENVLTPTIQLITSMYEQ